MTGVVQSACCDQGALASGRGAWQAAVWTKLRGPGMWKALLVLGLGVGSGLPAGAETLLDGAGFEARVAGQTLAFSSGGQAYGFEQYLPGRRVLWAFAGGQCRAGRWFEPDPGRICFVYEHDPEPQCWAFFEDAGRIKARFEGAAPGDELIETARSPAPLNCPGPDVGA